MIKQTMDKMDDIRKRYWAEPFEPFDLELYDGRTIRVHQRDLIALSPTGKSVFVGQPDGEDDLVRLKNVERIIPVPADASI